MLAKILWKNLKRKLENTSLGEKINSNFSSSNSCLQQK